MRNHSKTKTQYEEKQWQQEERQQLKSNYVNEKCVFSRPSTEQRFDNSFPQRYNQKRVVYA